MYAAELDCLINFLSIRPDDSLPVLELFAAESGAVSRLDGGKSSFVYLPGARADRVLVVAHADTVWDRSYAAQYLPEEELSAMEKALHRPVLEWAGHPGNAPYSTSDAIVIQGGDENWGIGADDRAGCAMAWLLRRSGHSVLITDGEEHGQIAASWIAENRPELFAELNAHSWMLQLDRRNGRDYKTYRLRVSDEFRRYIEENTGYEDAGSSSRTDICALCREICGVNLSVGYYGEHSAAESLDVGEWLHTCETVRRLLEKPQPRFPLE